MGGAEFHLFKSVTKFLKMCKGEILKYFQGMF